MKCAINNYKQGEKKPKIAKANWDYSTGMFNLLRLQYFIVISTYTWWAVSIAKSDMFEMSPRRKKKKKLKEQYERILQDNMKSTIICIRNSHEERIKDQRDLNIICD